VPTGNWTRIEPTGGLPPGDRVHYFQRVSCPPLDPGRSYTARMQAASGTVATATFRTLPDELPDWPDRPFTVLLGSCFCLESDQQGDVGYSFFWLPEDDRPTVKILCGDQVYLDIGTWVLQNFPDDEAWLGGTFLRKYVETWSQTDPAEQRGFGLILQEGANYFASDDHEFWNNFPNRATIVQNTWREDGRGRWERPARYLYQTFQDSTPDRPKTFDVDPVSFFLLDCRFAREPGEERFAHPDRLNELKQWVEGLNASRRFGLLCLGQPIFEKPGSWFSRTFADKNLPDYKQYDDLVRVLAQCRRPLVVLTGDVHYGRVARCRLPTGADLVEIISSPSSVVPDPRERIHPRVPQAPSSDFPPEAGAVARVPVETQRTVAGAPALTALDHFLTINLWRRGSSVRLQLKYWPVRTNGQRPTPIHRILFDLTPP